MPSLSLMRTLFRECLTPALSPRVNEPDLVMDDPEKVAAYTRAGREDGVMAPVYLFNAAQVSELVRPGDRVLDLGCGPATQLAMVARLHPRASFIGLDLSPDMLERASDLIEQQQLENVTLKEGDITDLSDFPDGSLDVVFSTVALHHLPDERSLDAAFSEVARVLKRGGGLYLLDFGHLKSEKSIQFFAYQYADRQPELFTLDYLYSLRAAFSLQVFKELAQRRLPAGTKVHSTFLMPYMVAIKRPRAGQGAVEPAVRRELMALRQALPAHHKKDLADLSLFFRLGGVPRVI